MMLGRTLAGMGDGFFSSGPVSAVPPPPIPIVIPAPVSAPVLTVGQDYSPVAASSGGGGSIMDTSATAQVTSSTQVPMLDTQPQTFNTSSQPTGGGSVFAPPAPIITPGTPLPPATSGTPASAGSGIPATIFGINSTYVLIGGALAAFMFLGGKK